MLKDINADVLKIDMGFLRKTGNPKRARVILNYTIDMAHELGMKVITEGLETREQLDFLKEMGCEMFQGFYFDKPTSEAQNYLSSQYVRDYDYTGNILEYDENTGIATVEQRSKMVVGDEVEIFGPFEDFFVQKIEEMYDPEGQPISSCPHPKQIFKLRTAKPVKPGWIIRRQK
jgi:hypothetical protein